jgi:hypothetical protein
MSLLFCIVSIYAITIYCKCVRANKIFVCNLLLNNDYFSILFLLPPFAQACVVTKDGVYIDDVVHTSTCWQIKWRENYTCHSVKVLVNLLTRITCWRKIFHNQGVTIVLMINFFFNNTSNTDGVGKRKSMLK